MRTDGTTKVAFDSCDVAGAPVFICGHGAGGSMSDRGLLAVTKAIRESGMHTVRFNFPYRDRKSGRPDPMPVLTSCIEAVVMRVRSEHPGSPIIIGGRSMGGRAASVLAAQGFSCDGLLLLAYPLHPPGRFDKLRDAHLPAISTPTLCFNGTRDDFCRRDLMEQVMTRVQPSFRMHWIEGADHSFRVLKSSGRTEVDVMSEIAVGVGKWEAGSGKR